MFRKILSKPTSYLVNLIERIHLFIFNTPMGTNMRNFLTNLSWVSLGTFIASIFLFLTNIFAGRWLGPIEYGKYSMIIYLGGIFTIPILMGNSTSLIKNLSSESNTKNKKSLISSTFFLIIFSIILSGLLTRSFSTTIQTIFHVDQQILFWAFLYGTILSIKLLTEATLKGSFLFTTISKLEITSSIIVFIVFYLQFFYSKNQNYTPLFNAIFLSLIVYIVLSLKNTFKYLSFPSIKASTITRLFSYSKFAFLGSISGLLIGNIDKLVLNDLLGYEKVGLYSVYLNASTTVSSIFLTLFLNVFFPTISRIDNKVNLLTKIFQLFKKLFVFLFILNCTIILISLSILGPKYETNYLYVFLFAIQNILLILSNMLWWSVNSIGTQGIKYTAFTGMLIGTSNLLLTISLTKYLSITGVILSSIITNLLMIYFARQKILSLNK